MTGSETLSLCVSAASAAATFYFWLVKANRERPRLEAAVVGITVVQIKPGQTEKTRWLGLNLRLAVTNTSLRPDVLTAASVRVRGANGQWAGLPAAPGVQVGSNSPLPVKLASSQAEGVQVWVWVEVPPQGMEVRFHPEYLAYVRKALPVPLRLKVELGGLGETHTGETTLDV